ncbi:MAG TPA: TauD/TfdA family dioxygenase [Casimicrobiaceae bacterium]|nr:TauD/TfdA family dioxygenase [Casimicrobiaceae bacterium]
MKPRVLRVANGLAARVEDLDLTQPLDDESFACVHRALLDHLVVILPNQDITPEQHITFSRRFGELDRHESLPHYRHPDHPEILLITNRTINGKPSETRNTGRQWHIDLSYTLQPSLGSLLHCKEIPEVGGDTVFANMYLAYETLSPTLRSILDGLHAVHDFTTIKANAKRDPEQLANMTRLNPPVAQPVVQVHPETGRKSLYVTEMLTSHFVGMTVEESRPLLQYLFAHSVQPEFTYRHRWQVGDLVIWDNRCTMHLALSDFDASEPRHMFRTTLKGTPSGRLYRPEANAQ